MSSEIKFIWGGVDFRPDAEGAIRSGSQEVLDSQAKIGCYLFFNGGRWENGGSQKIYLEAEPTGDYDELLIPESKFHPQKDGIEVTLPIFDIAVARLAAIPQGIGRAAIAYLKEGQYPSIIGYDRARTNEVLGRTAPYPEQTYFGKILWSSVHSITRVE